MPTTRPTRSQQQNLKSIYAESDSEEDTEPEQETPKPNARSLAKKRLSEIYTPDQDASFSSDGGRAPLKSVNINDDAAEKRRRRKSAKVVRPADSSENAQAGPSSEGANGEEEGAGENSRAAAQARQKQQLLSIAQAPVINVPLDVMSSNFEEWMKMATDNKINAANSWNFALIDYFHDMSLLRNDIDNSINFQRASCTLDGCVKIWTSRVDSVGTETGKLLSNLAHEGRMDGDDDEEGANSDNPDGHDPTQNQRKRKAHRAESTLAKSVAQLRSKKLDLEFSVDPLFRKTCADFDEGGAQGLLMNHLGLGVGTDGSLRVVFDASDSMGKGEEEEPLEEPQDELDRSYLRTQFFPDVDILEDMEVSHALESFSFSKDAFSFDEPTLFREDTPRVDDDDDDDDHDAGPFGGDGGQDFAPPMDIDDGAAPAEDFFVGDQAVGDDFGGADFGGSDLAGGDNGSVGPEVAPGEPGRPGAFVPFDPRRVPNERDLVMAMTEGNNEGGGLMMDYFDQSFLKNWAGPEHWKLRKVVRRPEAADVAAAKPKREKKEAFKIDFLTPAEKGIKELSKELFAPVTRGAGITLPLAGKTSGRKGARGKKAKEKEKRNDQTLPDDMHFSSRQLVTLFLKPKFSLKMRGHRVRMDGRGDGEIDENFWAQAAANQAAGQDGEDADETANGGAIPFNTQFFHDDYDDGPGFDDVFEGGDQDAGLSVEPGEQDLLAATQGQTRRVRPEFVNYAKRAKRVDVRKLKDNIWKGLDIVAPTTEEKEDLMDTDDRPATDPDDGRQFTSVISGLQRSYPKEKMEEISTSFCFICLLHLANERGLKLEVGAEADAEEEEDRKVGNIWDLKVFRDPHATPAA